jgi:hypothetical protein
MKLRGGEFSTGTTGIFQPELTEELAPRDTSLGGVFQHFYIRGFYGTTSTVTGVQLKSANIPSDAYTVYAH